MSLTDIWPSSMESDQIPTEKRMQAFLELHRQQIERFHQTQEIEWKVNIAFWTLLAGAAYLAKDHHLVIPPCIACIAVVVLVFMHGCWLHAIHKSEQVDKILWTRYRSEALLLLRGNQKPLASYEDEVEEREWALPWLPLEVGMTLILAVMLAFLATR